MVRGNEHIKNLRRAGFSELDIRDSNITLHITTDSKTLELLFPGCTVAWDINPVLRRWVDHYCVIRDASNNYNDDSHDGGSPSILIAYARTASGTVERMRCFIRTPHESKYYEFSANVRAVYVPSEERWVVLR